MLILPFHPFIFVRQLCLAFNKVSVKVQSIFREQQNILTLSFFFFFNPHVE